MYRAESILDPKRRGGRGAWKALAASIRERDNYTCRRCGTVHATGRQFPVDHVRPWRTFADKAEADQPDNLVTLCHTCHTHKTAVAERLMLRGDVLAFKKFLREVEL
jgi:5-methylcytosine-specific restriction endonuclease McrA